MKQTDVVKDIIRAPYAFPGGYPKFAIAKDGGCICAKCVKDNAKLIIGATRRHDADDWDVIAVDVNWEDSSLQCDNCGDMIEAAYSDERDAE